MNESGMTRCEVPEVDTVRSEVYLLSNYHLQSTSVIRRVYQSVQFILDPDLGLFVLSFSSRETLEKDP